MRTAKEKSCCVCGKTFRLTQSGLQRTCSFHCALEHEKSKNKQKKKAKLIAPISKKLASRLQIYRIRRDSYMKENMICECVGCGSQSADLHHMAGRIGNNLIETSTFMAVCRNCHIWIHEHPKEARALKYLK